MNNARFRTVKNRRTGDKQAIPILKMSRPDEVVTRVRGSESLEQINEIASLTQTMIRSTAFVDNIDVKPTGGENGFYTVPPMPQNERVNYQVVIPAYNEWDVLPEGLDKWQVYSGASWHEGLHARISPIPLFELQPDMPGVPRTMMRSLLNIVEDERIEDYGVMLHPGMIGRRELLRSFIMAGQTPIDKTPVLQADLRAQMFAAFFQRFRGGKVIGSMSDPQMRKWVEEASVYAKAEVQEINRLDPKQDGAEITRRMDKLVKAVAKKIHLDDDQNQSTSQGTQSGQHGQQGQQGDRTDSLGDVKKKKEESKQKEKPTDPNEVARKKLKDDDFREKVSEMNDAAKAGDNDKADKLKKEIMDDVKKEAEKNAEENAEKSEQKEKLKDKIKDKLKDKGVKGSDEDLDDLADKLADQKAEDVDPGDDDDDASDGKDAKKGSEKGGKKGDKKGDLDEAAEDAVDDFMDSPEAQDDHETGDWDQETIDKQNKDIAENGGAVDPDKPFKGGSQPNRRDVQKRMKKDLQNKMDKAKAEGREKREDGDASPEATAADINDAMNGKPEDRNQLDQIKHASERAELRGVADFAPVTAPASAAGMIDNGFKSKMRKKMQDWMTGRKTEYKESGSRFDPRSHILSHDTKNFKVIHRKSVKGQKYLFVVDFSGSIRTRVDDYKKALVNTFETLDSVGGNIAVVGFGTLDTPYGLQDGQFRVKTFEEGKWKKSNNGKLAGVQAHSMTPMAPCYRSIKNYVARHKPDYVITVTDGQPNDYDEVSGTTPETTEALKGLRSVSKSTRFVAFGLPDIKRAESIEKDAKEMDRQSQTASAARYRQEAELNRPEGMKKQFKQTGYQDSFSTDNIAKLPDLIVDLITPE
jgi:hypothetical protein